MQILVREFADEGKPILAISTPSFKGDPYAGYEIVLNGILIDILKKASRRTTS